MEGLKLYSSYQNAVGVDGAAIEFEWQMFPGFSSLSTLEKIQADMKTQRIQPEEFTDQIIYMSMFNDIVWNANDVFPMPKIKNYAQRFSAGHWTFLGPGSEEKWYGSSSPSKRAMELHSRQNGTAIQRDWSSCIQRCQCPESWSLEVKRKEKPPFTSTAIL